MKQFNVSILRDISYFTKLNRVELFELCSKVINYTRTDLNEFGTVYECAYAIVDRNVNGHTVHLDVDNLRWIAYNNGSIIITGVINGYDYTERY